MSGGGPLRRSGKSAVWSAVEVTADVGAAADQGCRAISERGKNSQYWSSLNQAHLISQNLSPARRVSASGLRKTKLSTRRVRARETNSAGVRRSAGDPLMVMVGGVAAGLVEAKVRVTDTGREEVAAELG